MKIAINGWFIHQPHTGSGQYITHLLRTVLAEGGNEHFLLCVPPQTAPPPWLTDRVTWQPLRFPLSQRGGLLKHLNKLWFEQIGFPQAARRGQADLLHVPYWASPLRYPRPVVVTIHDLIPLLLPEYQGRWPGRQYTRLVSASARRADLVLTDSEASRQDIVHHLNIPAGRVRTIHLAADAGLMPVADPDERERVRARYHLPPQYVLYLGGFDVRKNVPLILKAFARLPLPGARLVLAGQLPPQDTLFFPHPQPIIEQLGLQERVHLIGQVDEADKPALYSTATALIFPSRYEGFGLPPLEAMACGTPVIISNRSSLPEVVGAGGVCLDTDDPDELAQAMARIINDAAWREQLSQAALKQAQQFSWQRTARLTRQAWQDALRQ